MGKRGQLSLFIIIGLLLLLIAGLIYSLTQGLLPGFGVPNEIKDLKIYTETCMQTIAREGIDIMSVQGGYIDLPARWDKTAYIDNGYKIPYWYYEGLDRKPTRRSMSAELSRYIEMNLPECLDNYSIFTGRYDVVTGYLNASA